MKLTLRYMSLADIPAVIEIDRVSFDTPWSPRSYAYEVGESTYSHMVVLEQGSSEEQPKPGWRRLVQNISGNGTEPDRQIVGYGGLWHIMDEAHISTIATDPSYRGRGWGEVLLAGMIRRSVTLNAAYVVLEVRVSNVVAQRLYQKYAFQTLMLKPRYYHSDGEDAYDMRLTLERNHRYTERFERRYQDLLAQHEVEDQYSNVQRR